MESNQANLTLYTVIQDASHIKEMMKEHFKELTIRMEENEESLTLTLFDESQIVLNIANDPSYVNEQVLGMRNFYAQAPCENKELMEQILLQIATFTCISGIEFTIDELEERTNAIIGRIYAVAKDSASIILYPDMSLYTPQGKLLLSMEGNSELEEFLPIAYQDVLQQAPAFSKKDKERFDRVIAEIKGKGYPCISYMMSTQMSKETLQIPSVREIAERTAAVFSCAVCAEGTLMEGGSREIGLHEFDNLDKVFGCRQYLCESELQYINGENPDETTSIQFSWRYEAVSVLLWALGLHELNAMDEICDVAGMAHTIRSFSSIDEMCKAAKLRREEELLDMHAKVLYYDWACVEARIKHIELEGIDSGIVQEQHYAMNWLTGANQTKDWDKIQCNT